MTLWQQIWRRKPVDGDDGRDRRPTPTAASSGARSGCSSSRCSASAPRSAPASSSSSPRRRRSPGLRSSWSFVFAGVVAGLTAICYAELASAVPVSGSSYSYAYATLGEGIAMVVAACLLLEYGVSAAAVAVGWSQYLNEFLDNLFGFTIPDDLSNAPEADGIDQPAGDRPDRALHAAADPRRQRVGEGQRRDGADQARRARAVHRGRRDRLELRQPVGLHALRAVAASPRRRASSSSPTSGSTPSRRPARRCKNPRRNLPLAIMIALITVTSLYIARRARRGRRAADRRLRRPGGRPVGDPRDGDRLHVARPRCSPPAR